MFLKAELVNIKIKLDSKISKLEHLKSENISISVIGGDSEKNISKSRPKGSLLCNNNISAVSETSKNLSQYFAHRKIMNKVEKISTNILTHANDKIVPILESSKIDTEIKNVTLIRSYNITIRRSKKLPIIVLGASTVNKYQTTPINLYEDVSKIIHRYTDDVKNALMLKFDTSLDLQKEIELQQKCKIKNILLAEPTL
ncbi:2517_t:CDS:2 [Cetraspora pellucida]|uniref:2517_t:CDS:1 n=1 Tax=Cetraspora pellucida TaxID=1433469 RepID=A0A9N9NFS7_9GLOM|nr:2517_t:CDS:2 [Cetraspora pellucida]